MRGSTYLVNDGLYGISLIFISQACFARGLTDRVRTGLIVSQFRLVIALLPTLGNIVDD